MCTAIYPDNSVNPVKLQWTPSNASDWFLIYSYFLEGLTLKRNQTREFDIYLDGKLWDGGDSGDNGPVILDLHTVTMRYSRVLEKPVSKHELVIQKTKKSTLPLS